MTTRINPVFWLLLGLFNTVVYANIPPYLAREKAVSQRYETYLTDFKKAFSDLEKVMTREAPEIWATLKREKPVSKGWGYGLLPKIYRHSPPKEPFKVQSTVYSWKRTDGFITNEVHRVEELKEKLKAIQKLSPKERNPVLKKIAEDVKLMRANQRIIEDHVNYNRFWQKSIHEAPQFYRRLTLLHDAVVERQSLLENYAKAKDPALLARADQLYQKILEGGQTIDVPPFVEVEERITSTILFVPIYTDVKDPKFLKRFKDVIEKTWSVSEKGRHYGVKVIFRQIQNGPYKKGQHISLPESLKRFSNVPAKGAALTTGAENTHASPGRYVVLGPQDLSENTLAHEFGHILGFVDAYFRGFRDIGAEGYEVMEIVPDPDDIMCRPGEGRVLKSHFNRILNQIKIRDSKASRSSQTPSK